MELFGWVWLGTIVVSYAKVVYTLLKQTKTLANKGYKWNYKKIKEIGNSGPEERKNITKLIFCIPLINLAYSFSMSKVMKQNIDNYINQGLIEEFTKEEQAAYDKNPSLSKTLDFIAKDMKADTPKTVSFTDENNEPNKIEYIFEGDIPVLKECHGPISEKNKLEQRAKLLQVLHGKTSSLEMQLNINLNQHEYYILRKIKDSETTILGDTEDNIEYNQEELEHLEEISQAFSNFIDEAYFAIKKENPELSDTQISEVIYEMFNIITNAYENDIEPPQKQFVKRK